ncbi:cyclic nucleotide-gated cation channel beta-3-like isoform X2 [Limulus polyphemus]|uniref:Cyclic nucleotide-gated cation channel beta-3-like isoform X2 n=1 Tax=Limulus polyphemus TaxID=6850 RepID=A0ABM1TKD5_LIMPO|nr:cyclic nucleotide-gated cation channel beta-3-like isoform X2 [Limulus polyphemus]
MAMKEKVCSHHQKVSPDVASSRINYVTLPNVPDTTSIHAIEIQSPLPEKLKKIRTHKTSGIINTGYVPDSEEHSFIKKLPMSVVDQNTSFQSHSKETVPTITVETSVTPQDPAHWKDSLPIEDESWSGSGRASNVYHTIQRLVQAFAERARRVKEKIVQTPTPSPTSSLNEEENEKQHDRPRLASLIQNDDPSAANDWMEEDKGIWYCRMSKQLLLSFPRVLDPQSKVYISWLLIVTLCFVYNAWSIFLRAVFQYQTPESLPYLLSFDYFSDAIYIIDMVVFKVRVKYLHEGFWVEDLAATRKNYFKKTMFKMDLLSLFPLDLLYLVYGFNALFRFPRMLKVQTFWEFFNRMDAVAKSPYVVRILRTLIYMMYLIHLNACGYYAMSVWEGIGSNDWVFQGEGNAYIRCMYFATKTATSIGKNPKPKNEYEYIFMTFSWLTGVFIFAFLIGQIRDIVATATQNTTQYHQVMDQMVRYMRHLNLPENLQYRVRLWLNHTWEQQKTLHESKILDSLPMKMKTDVAINVHYNTLVKVQLFKNCDKALLRDLVLKLRPVLFLPGDNICRKGELGKEMYIVNKGLVQVMGGEEGDVVLATLSEGSVFGEISLLGIPGCNRRTADVRSKGFSNLFVLGKADLWDALEHYPDAQAILKKKAQTLIKQNEDREKLASGSRKKIEAETIIRDPSRTPTPRLLKTVLEVVHPNSMCAQLFNKKRSSAPVLIGDRSQNNLLPSPRLRASSVSGVGYLSLNTKQDGFLNLKMPSLSQKDDKVSLENFLNKTSEDIAPKAIKELLHRVPTLPHKPSTQSEVIRNLETEEKVIWERLCSHEDLIKSSAASLDELPMMGKPPTGSGLELQLPYKPAEANSCLKTEEKLAREEMCSHGNLITSPVDEPLNNGCNSSNASSASEQYNIEEEDFLSFSEYHKYKQLPQLQQSGFCSTGYFFESEFK